MMNRSVCIDIITSLLAIMGKTIPKLNLPSHHHLAEWELECEKLGLVRAWDLHYSAGVQSVSRNEGEHETMGPLPMLGDIASFFFN